MYNFITLKCCYCSSVITNLPDSVVVKLEGLTFECESCSHSNILSGSEFHKCPQTDSTSIFSLLDQGIPA